MNEKEFLFRTSKSILRHVQFSTTTFGFILFYLFIFFFFFTNHNTCSCYKWTINCVWHTENESVIGMKWRNTFCNFEINHCGSKSCSEYWLSFLILSTRSSQKFCTILVTWGIIWQITVLFPRSWKWWTDQWDAEITWYILSASQWIFLYGLEHG